MSFRKRGGVVLTRKTKRYHLAEMAGIHYHDWTKISGPIPELDSEICSKCGLVSKWGSKRKEEKSAAPSRA